MTQRKAMPTAKKAFEIGKITKVMQGHNRKVRIDAVVRDYNSHPDLDKYFSNWITEKYANKLCQEHYFKNVNEMKCYKY
jgi:hypothetical protein